MADEPHCDVAVLLSDYVYANLVQPDLAGIHPRGTRVPARGGQREVR